MPDDEQLKRRIARQVNRMKKAEQARPTLLAHTRFLGSIGLLFVLPMVIGAYAGRWLDERLSGYSVSWTLGLIVLGIVVGAINVYLFIRTSE